jgi:hypothetical protein
MSAKAAGTTMIKFAKNVFIRQNQRW